MSESQLQQALELIDEINLQDPSCELLDNESKPKEWLYGVRMSACLAEFKPEASAELQIAARAQHIKRWVIPRSDYPLGREGYNRWRQALGRFHAETTAEILAEVGYDEAFSKRVQGMLRKEKLKRDPEVQALEDVICLVFLTYYLAPFAEKHNEDKLLVIIRKTWAKMSEEGHAAALQLPLSESQLALITKALA